MTMFDGSELGEAIAADPDDPKVALDEYERALFPRSEKFAGDSDRNQELLVGDNSPHSFLMLITGHDVNP